MELVHGVTLEDEIFSGAPLSVPRILRIMEQVAGGLGEAHRLGFVHRDVKPMNIMLRPNHGMEHVTILDFGIVGLRTEALDARLTATGFLIGTPAYMAPEQACDPSGVTPAADFYSLGVILFEMLTGKLPFNATQPVDMIVQHSIQPIPEIPPADGLEDLCRWMLQKRPQDRPQTAQQIIDELHRIEHDLRAAEEAHPTPSTDDFPLLEPVTYLGVEEHLGVEERLDNIKKTLSGVTTMRPEVRHTFDARLAELVAQSRPGRLSYLYRDLEAKIAELERALAVYG
jgi:serine/threonine protein kinase